MAKVVVDENGCWIYMGRANKNGYGAFNIRGLGSSAHRVSYILHRGPVGTDMHLDHRCHDPKKCSAGVLCRHRRCVNPDHLNPCTPKENNSRERKGPGTGRRYSGVEIDEAHKDFRRDDEGRLTHCHRGHEFTAEITRKTSTGGKLCMRCSRIRYIKLHSGPVSRNTALVKFDAIDSPVSWASWDWKNLARGCSLGRVGYGCLPVEPVRQRDER